MKKIALCFLLFASLNGFSQTQTFHDFSGKTIHGDSIDFSIFYGKKLMVVNTATYCSWTYQYEALEALYTQYKDSSNFMIIGFPCNDFGFQEPSNDSTINAFCEEEYNIDFQMMSKVKVVSNDTADVYKWLQKAHRNGVADVSVNWNFNKFLIDEKGHWVAHYNNNTEPNAPAIIAWLKSPSVIDTTSTTGIASSELAENMSAAVAGDRLTVSFQHFSSQKTTIALYSASGQLISTLHDGLLPDDGKISTGIASLSNGIYFIRATQGQGSATHRFAVTR